MAFTRLIPFCALLAMFGISAGPARAEPTKHHGIEPETFDAIMKLVEDAANAKNYRHDQKQGDGRSPYEDTPTKPGILIGLDVWPGVRDRTTQYVRGVRPLFLNNKGNITEGKIHGWVGAGSVRLKAKPGYAVGGLKVHTSFGELSGLSVVFYKIGPTGLDTTDSYESKYFGNQDPNTAKLVGGTGEPIMGIYGLVADNGRSNDFGLGLVIMGEKAKKKKK